MEVDRQWSSLRATIYMASDILNLPRIYSYMSIIQTICHILIPGLPYPKDNEYRCGRSCGKNTNGRPRSMTPSLPIGRFSNLFKSLRFSVRPISECQFFLSLHSRRIFPR